MPGEMQVIQHVLEYLDARSSLAMTSHLTRCDATTVEGIMLYPGDPARLDTDPRS